MKSVILVYLRLAQLLLAMTIAVKIAGFFVDAPYLLSPDPVFGLPLKHLLAFAITCECAVLGLTALGAADSRGFLGLLQLSLLFAPYRVAWHLTGSGVCPCLGTLGDSFGLKDEVLSWLGGLTLFLWGVPSAFILFQRWLSYRTTFNVRKAAI